MHPINGFSVQFLASHVVMVDPPMFGGGSAPKFARFYQAMGYTIPSGNLNAEWTDHDGWYCKTPPATIHTQPNVPLSAINVSMVSTFTNDEAVAIANLKSALAAGHPLYFVLTLANDPDWETFCVFWARTNATEETVINLDYGGGHQLDNTGGSHLMAVVGYNDLDPDPAKHYWLVLNSWGNANGTRPNGVFRMAMHTKYDAFVHPAMGDDAPIFEWGLMDTQFATKLRKGIGGLTLNTQSRDPNAGSFQISRMSFPKTADLTNVYSASVGINGRYYACSPAGGNWTQTTNGFHYQSRAGNVPNLQMDIDPVSCTWSMTATNVSAEDSRYLDPHAGLCFTASCRLSENSDYELTLCDLRAVAYDELVNSATSGYSSPAPDSPMLSVRLTGGQSVLRIAGETGSTCQVLESEHLGGAWSVRAQVPMTEPVEEVTLPAPPGTSLFWRVKVQ